MHEVQRATVCPRCCGSAPVCVADACAALPTFLRRGRQSALSRVRWSAKIQLMRSGAQACLLFTTCWLLGCTRDEKPERSTFYERQIAPVLEVSCAPSSSQSTCHGAADDKGNASGNLNLESYDTLNLRRDLLVNYGPYGVPGLLLKALPPFQLRLTSWDG